MVQGKTPTYADLLRGIKSARMRHFVEQFLRLRRADLAYQRAYTAEGKKPLSLGVCGAGGSRLLLRNDVSTAIAAGEAERAVRLRIKPDRIVRELKTLSLSSIDHYRISPEGEVTLAEGAPKDAMRAVRSIKKRMHMDKDGCHHYEVEISLWDKPGSIKLIGDHLGMFVKKVDVTSGGKPIEAKAQVMIINGQEVQF